MLVRIMVPEQSLLVHLVFPFLLLLPVFPVLPFFKVHLVRRTSKGSMYIVKLPVEGGSNKRFTSTRFIEVKMAFLVLLLKAYF